MFSNTYTNSGAIKKQDFKGYFRGNNKKNMINYNILYLISVDNHDNAIDTN